MASASDSSTDWKGFKNILFGGGYFGDALNYLSLLWRHQNIVNDVKNQSNMADNSII